MYSVENTLNYVTVQKHKRICDSVGNTQEFVTVQETPNYLSQCRKHPRICYSVGNTREFVTVQVKPKNLLQLLQETHRICYSVQETSKNLLQLGNTINFLLLRRKKNENMLQCIVNQRIRLSRKIQELVLQYCSVGTPKNLLKCGKHPRMCYTLWKTPKNFYVTVQKHPRTCNCIETSMTVLHNRKQLRIQQQSEASLSVHWTIVVIF